MGCGTDGMALWFQSASPAWRKLALCQPLLSYGGRAITGTATALQRAMIPDAMPVSLRRVVIRDMGRVHHCARAMDARAEVDFILPWRDHVFKKPVRLRCRTDSEPGRLDRRFSESVLTLARWNAGSDLGRQSRSKPARRFSRSRPRRWRLIQVPGHRSPATGRRIHLRSKFLTVSNAPQEKLSCVKYLQSGSKVAWGARTSHYAIVCGRSRQEYMTMRLAVVIAFGIGLRSVASSAKFTASEYNLSSQQPL